MNENITRSDFEKLVIARNYIKALEKENEILKKIAQNEREEREAEKSSFIDARNNILKMKPQERKEIQKTEEVKKWKSIAKILSGKIDRLEKQNKDQKLALDHTLSKLSLLQDPILS